ncbi:MAG: RNA polymerase sigma-70 factor, partial [Parabacteroides sp.]|nr:RNA polymerase sigma-70 factor [Parabacteroides sp.]
MEINTPDHRTAQVRFEEIYLSYFSKMKRFANEYVLSEEDAENIVHAEFAELW